MSLIFSNPNVYEKRKKFRASLCNKKILRFIGTFSPLVSKLIEKKGFEGLYVSGAVISSDLCLPDLEMNHLSDLTTRGGQMIASSPLPALADADTGFGGNLNVARSVQKLEMAGFCGLHLEDQESPKKCGHLDNKKLISTKSMQKKIEVALKAKTDPNFLIMARIDARGPEDLKATIERGRAYLSAGAEALFPEALENKEEFEEFRQKVDGPLLANMTEFGKSKILSAKALEKMGYNIALYPVTLWRLALKAVQQGLEVLDSEGNQKKLLAQMLSREELYELIQYEKYVEWDKNAGDKK